MIHFKVLEHALNISPKSISLKIIIWLFRSIIQDFSSGLSNPKIISTFSFSLNLGNKFSIFY